MRLREYYQATPSEALYIDMISHYIIIPLLSGAILQDMQYKCGRDAIFEGLRRHWKQTRNSLKVNGYTFRVSNPSVFILRPFSVRVNS